MIVTIVQVLAIMAVAALLCWIIINERVSEWNRHEAGYWRTIAKLIELTDHTGGFADLLGWVKANDPTTLEKLRGWKSPMVRRNAQRLKEAKAHD